MSKDTRLLKIKDGYALNKVADSFVIVPVGDNFVDFSSVFTTNETGAFIWNCLLSPKTRKELCSSVMAEFEGVSSEEASKDIDDFISALEKCNMLE